MQFQESKWSR